MIRPIHDRILIRKIEPIYAGNLIVIREDRNSIDSVNGDYRRQPVVGVVIACGPGKYDAKGKWKGMWVKPGDIVTCGSWDDMDEYMPGHALIRQEDLFGVLEDA